MAAITSEQVMTLRSQTGAGIMDCKGALNEAGGDMAKAVEILRKKGLAGLAKRAGRAMKEGVVTAKSANGVYSLLEINCETDFVAKNPDFKALCHDLCMQIAAANPLWVRKDEVPADTVAKEKEIAEGAVAKWMKDVVLLEQPFVKEMSKNVETLVNELVAKIGEKISVRRFVRYEVGEGLEKRKSDIAAEVAAEVAKHA